MTMLNSYDLKSFERDYVFFNDLPLIKILGFNFDIFLQFQIKHKEINFLEFNLFHKGFFPISLYAFKKKHAILFTNFITEFGNTIGLNIGLEKVSLKPTIKSYYKITAEYYPINDI